MMGHYFIVDRSKILRVGQIINLVTYSDITPPELQAHVDSLFPDGFTFQGDHYFLQKGSSPKHTAPIIELVFEYVRRSYFPSRPSRFQSIFAYDSLDLAKRFRREHGKPDDPIWEIESESAFKADMNLVVLGSSSLVLSYFAHQYWSGASYKDGPFWEYLLVPPVRVIRRVDKNNEKEGVE